MVFLILLKGIVRQIINTWSVMIVVKKVYTLLILMQNNLYGQAMSQYLPYLVDLNG